MNAMILAAGRGERLKPLTDHCPKPLIAIDGKPIIEHTLVKLAALGVRRVVINVWHLAEQLISYIGDGSAWNVTVAWSHEPMLLDTGGGMRNAIHLLGSEPFLAINGDVLWEMDLHPLIASFVPEKMDALLGLVPNPQEKKSDFILEQGYLRRAAEGADGLTYSGIQMVSPKAISPYPIQPFSLNRFYDDCITNQRLAGIALSGAWADIGTWQRLTAEQHHWKFPIEKKPELC